MMNFGAAPPLKDKPLPTLREDLQFLQAADDANNRSGFLIFDPMRHKYFRVGREASLALANWGEGTIAALVERMRTLGLESDPDQIDDLVAFCEQNRLTNPTSGTTARLLAHRERTRQPLYMKLVHNYLFFKIPLVRPQRFLDAAWPFVRLLGTRQVHWAVIMVTIAGLYLTGRQWDVFWASFANFGTLNGILVLGLSIGLLKSAHELGHAFVAKAYGLKVPVMGVAFMVLVPMLYSDVTDTWRLRKKRQRLMVAGAGMLVELSIGGVCLLLWALSPPGVLRDLFFFMATTGWAMSLAINLSPLMRFDGYHLLADALGVHNLQQRGFAIGRWQLRKWLFGLNDERPEVFRPSTHRALVAYAFATWVYRFFLFLGIAVLVYYMVFKVLGIILFAVELVWFIGLPIYSELKVWFARRRDIVATSHGRVGLAGFVVLGLLLFAPLQRDVHVPAVFARMDASEVYSPIPARVEQVLVETGMRVKKGEVLVRLSSPDHEYELKKARLKLDLIERQIDRGVSVKAEKAQRFVLKREATALRAEIAGLEERQRNLVLRAGFDGVVTDKLTGLAPGLWVTTDQALLNLTGEASPVEVRGLVAESDIARLAPGQRGRFVFENPQLEAIDVTLNMVGQRQTAGRELIYLSQTGQGPIAVTRSTTGETKPTISQYLVTFSPTNHPPNTWLHEARGTVVIKAAPTSIASRFTRHAMSVLRREAGF